MNATLADVSASGPHFRDHHLLFDGQGDQLFAMTDPIAERVRKIGGTTQRALTDDRAAQAPEMIWNGGRVDMPFLIHSLCAMIIAVALAHAGVAASLCPECENGRAFRAELESAMRTMDKAMAEAPMTGDPDRDFVTLMIP